MSTKEGAKREGLFDALLRSRGYRIAMKYLYAWGMSVVIIGALFKILHFPGANEMLIVGLGTLSMVFFISGLEPLPEEEKHWDWSKVFPQLAEEDSPKLDRGVGGAEGLMSGLGSGHELLGGGGLTPDMAKQLASSVEELRASVTSLTGIIQAHQAQVQALSHAIAQLSAAHEAQQKGGPSQNK